jgi:EmrB/QacA subfamily drug resistance transporter
MALIDVTIVNISIPELQKKLHAGVDTVSWVLNAYNITFALLLVSMGRLADQFGRRRFFLLGMTLFTIGSALCAAAWSIDALIAFRIVQAVGAGILAPLALATTAMVFPPQQRGLGLALIAVVANVAAALGPLIGGVLIELASWHWIFIINVPIGIVGVVMALRVMPETYDLSASRQVDFFGMVLLGGAIFSLTYGLVEANSKGWGSTEIVGLFVASALLLAAFAASQRYGRAPMLTRKLVTNTQFMGACTSMLLFAIGVMGLLFLFVIALVNLWGYTQLEAALAISPVALLGMVVSPFVGRMADRLPPWTMAVPALLLMSGGLLWFSDFPTTPDYLRVLPALVLIGAGMGATFPSTNVGAMGAVTGQELGLGSGIVNMARQVGFAIGVALLVAVFTGTVNSRFDGAKREATVVTQRAGLDGAQQRSLLDRVFQDPAEAGQRFEPHTPVERQVDALGAGAARDGFSAGFRVAALAVLLAAPFALLMRRRPGDHHAPKVERAEPAVASR